MHLDKKTGSPVKKTAEPGDEEAIEKAFADKEDEKISFRQAPIRSLREQGPPEGTLQPAGVNGPDQLLGDYQRRRA